MRVLIITQHYLNNNANANCLENLVSEIKNDCYVSVLVLRKNDDEEIKDGVKIYNHSREIKYKENINYLIKNNETGIIELFKYVIKKITVKIFTYKNFLKWKYDTDNVMLFDKLEQIIQEDGYDCIVSTCIPFSCHYLAYKFKKTYKSIHWVAYYLDPFSFNRVEKGLKTIKRRFENRVLGYADKVILTPKMYEEFSSSKLKEYLKKSIICEFPLVKEHTIDTTNNTIKFEKEKINCVFIGYLYPDIRNPKYFLDLLSSCSTNIKFYIIGGVYGDYEKLDMDLYKDKLKDRLEIVEAVPLHEAFRIMNDADILVNIGNSIQNQLPSKIFDYISTGKPIVNVVKVDNCQTIDYMDKYPIALNIFEKDGVTKTVISEFENFCNEKKGKKVPFDEVKRLYETSTPEYVAKQFSKIIN